MNKSETLGFLTVLQENPITLSLTSWLPSWGRSTLKFSTRWSWAKAWSL